MDDTQNNTKMKSSQFSKTDTKALDSKEHTVPLSKTRLSKTTTFSLSHSSLYHYITPFKYL